MLKQLQTSNLLLSFTIIGEQHDQDMFSKVRAIIFLKRFL